MMVRLSPELFEPPTEDLSLLGVFEHGWQGEHRVDVDTAHMAVANWLAAQSTQVREQCELSVGATAHEEALQPTAVTIMVVPGDDPTGPATHLVSACEMLALCCGSGSRSTWRTVSPIAPSCAR